MALALATIALALASWGLVVFPIAVAAGLAEPTAVGLALAAYPAGYGLMQLPAGFAIELLGGRPVIVAAGLGMAAGFALMLADGWTGVAGRVIGGACAGLVLTAGFDLLAASERRATSTRFSIFVGGWGAGLLAGGLWALVADTGAARALAGWCSALVALGVALGVLALRPAGSRRVPGGSHFSLPRERYAWIAIGALAVVSLANLFVQIGLISWTSIWLSDAGYGITAAGGLPMLGFGLGFGLGSVVGGRLTLSVPSLFVAASVLSGVAALLVAVGRHLPLVILALSIAGAGSALYVGPGYAWLRSAVRSDYASRAAATTNGIAWAGSAAAPVAIGALLDFSATLAFLQLTAVALGGALVAYRLAALPQPRILESWPQRGPAMPASACSNMAEGG
jgi:MFS family permease